jgi:hypothetical protein
LENVAVTCIYFDGVILQDNSLFIFSRCLYLFLELFSDVSVTIFRYFSKYLHILQFVFLFVVMLEHSKYCSAGSTATEAFD